MRWPASPACTCPAKAALPTASGTGTIGDLFIDDTANINLQLDTPVNVRASAKDFKLDALCMHGKVARLCGEAAWNETGWTARADAHNLPISTLTAGLTPNVEYQGTVNATASASSTGGAPLVGEARVDLVDAAIQPQARERPHRRHQFRLRLRDAEGGPVRSSTASCGSTPRSAA